MGLIIVGILVGGMAGGTANFLSIEPSEDKPQTLERWLRFVAVGIVAAATVPLFLSITDSTIVNELSSDTDISTNFFIFLGVCIVAAFASRAFLESLSKKLIEGIENAEAKAIAAQQSAETATELAEEVGDLVEGGETSKELPQPVATQLMPLTPDEKKVLNATAKLTMRTASGIAKDARLERGATLAILDSLADKGLVELSTSPRTGSPRHRVTPSGVSVVNQLRSGATT
jgi:DNA-binding MarR family transcriptional regulator/branched-subunit amino acid transport protein